MNRFKPESRKIILHSEGPSVPRSVLNKYYSNFFVKNLGNYTFSLSHKKCGDLLTLKFYNTTSKNRRLTHLSQVNFRNLFFSKNIEPDVCTFIYKEKYYILLYGWEGNTTTMENCYRLIPLNQEMPYIHTNYSIWNGIPADTKWEIYVLRDRSHCFEFAIQIVEESGLPSIHSNYANMEGDKVYTWSDLERLKCRPLRVENNGVSLPIVEEIVPGQYIFYPHNYEKFKNVH